MGWYDEDAIALLVCVLMCSMCTDLRIRQLRVEEAGYIPPHPLAKSSPGTMRKLEVRIYAGARDGNRCVVFPYQQRDCTLSEVLAATANTQSKFSGGVFSPNQHQFWV